MLHIFCTYYKFYTQWCRARARARARLCWTGWTLDYVKCERMDGREGERGIDRFIRNAYTELLEHKHHKVSLELIPSYLHHLFRNAVRFRSRHAISIRLLLSLDNRLYRRWTGYGNFFFLFLKTKQSGTDDGKDPLAVEPCVISIRYAQDCIVSM